MSLFGPKKYAELRDLEEMHDGSASQEGKTSPGSAYAAVPPIVLSSQQRCASVGTNALPLLLSPLNPPVSLKHALFCGLMVDYSRSSHIDASGGSDSMFAYHSNTRNYIRRRDAPPPLPPQSNRIDYKTEWECEQGIIWPKIVNYAVQCSKGHNLASSSASVSFTASQTPTRPFLCRVCGQDPSMSHSYGGHACISPPAPAACRYCDYVVCQACVDIVATHAHQPPPPPPPFLLHRGVRLQVLKQFKKNWGQVYGRWTTEQVNSFISTVLIFHLFHPSGLPANNKTSHSSITRQLL